MASELAEAARQVWGSADERQVPGVQVALPGAGGGPRGTAVLLTKG
jgi:hypothetical protein